MSKVTEILTEVGVFAPHPDVQGDTLSPEDKRKIHGRTQGPPDNRMPTRKFSMAQKRQNTNRNLTPDGYSQGA